MNIGIFTDETRKAEWNRAAPHPMASWEWGEARKKMGIEVVRIACEQDGMITDVYQMTFHKIPHTPYSIGYVPRVRVPSKAVIEMFQQEGRKHRCIFVKCEPYVTVEEVQAQEKKILKEYFVRSSHGLFPEWTQTLDLRKSEDELLAAMKPKWRYNIKVAAKNGVMIKELTDDEGFRNFSDLYFKTTNRQKYKGHNQTYHKIIFDTLKDSIAHLLIAFYNDKPLSAYQLFVFNNKLYYPYGGSSDEHKNVMASNLLMWEAIRFGKKHGLDSFDMWGSLGPDYEKEAGGWSGFTRFKAGFGTTFVQFVGSYDLVLMPFLYRLYGYVYGMRKLFLRL